MLHTKLVVIYHVAKKRSGRILDEVDRTLQYKAEKLIPANLAFQPIIVLTFRTHLIFYTADTIG